ncbi:MAG: glycoside hydrolase family 28 protein [Clostridiales bacterium]|jgi:polygalacturonase|nr:glycoside hydrolase family 28 protein [Clostridiales bacterium]
MKLVFKNARCAVIDLESRYFLKEPAELYVNGILHSTLCTSASSISGLEPDTDYTFKVNGESASFSTEKEEATLNVRDFGASGNGSSDDTVFIQAAIMACPEKGRVLIPSGSYRVTSLFLKSGLNIELEKGATLKAETERFSHPILPGVIKSLNGAAHCLGSWEGAPNPMFAGVLNGFSVENICIYGEGSIDGQASNGNWWREPKKMAGAFRPRLIYLHSCKNASIVGLTLKNSPSWTIHPIFSERVGIYAISAENPADSPNTDGLDIESCKNVCVCGAKFDVGDDCIAVKSGRVPGARPSEDIKISACLMQNGHGAVTVGSEMSGGVKGLSVRRCFFKGTDRGLRVKTRRGRGGVIEDVLFQDIDMDGVLTPITANCFYFCDPDGESEYVQSRSPKPIDEGTPAIRTLAFKNITAEGAHFAAAYFIGLPEMKIEKVAMENVKISFSPEAKPGRPVMHSGAPLMCRAGIFSLFVEEMELSNVEIAGQAER